MEQTSYPPLRRREVSTGALLFLVAVQAVLVLAAVLGGIFYNENGISLAYSDQMRWGYSLCVVAAYLWCLGSWIYVKKTMINVYFFFLGALFFNHAGQILTFAFGLGNEYHTDVYAVFSSQLMIKGLRYQLLCILLLQMGALVSQLLTRPKAADPARYSRDWGRPTRVLFSEETNVLFKKIFLFLTVLTSLMAFYDFYQILRYRVNVNYTEMSLEGAAVTTFNVNSIFSFFLFLLLVLYFDHQRVRRVIIGIVLIVSACWYLSGTRSPSVAMILELLVIYYFMNGQRLFRRLTAGKIAAFAIAGILLLQLMSVGQTMRHYTLSELFSPNSNIEFDTPFSALVSLLNETGFSFTSLLYTMTYVPDYVGYMDNYTYNILLVFVPTPVLNLLGVSAPPISNLAAWVTQMVGSKAGLGYSCMAEAYLAWDMYGCIIMSFFGAGFVAIENFLVRMWRKGHFIALACLGSVATIAFGYSRSEFRYMMQTFRFLFYVLLAYGLIYFITTRYLEDRRHLKRE